MTTKTRRHSQHPRKLHTRGEVYRAQLALGPPPFITRTKSSGAKAAGQRYERRVQEHLAKSFPNTYVIAPWIRYLPHPAARWYWCQPDGLFIDLLAGLITIVEVKLSHCPEAWWQVRRLYGPVVQRLFGPDFEYAAVEIVRWYDPHTSFPESFTLTPHPCSVPAGKFGVHIWG